jgi:hypothetical protein
MGPRAGLDEMEKWKFLILPGLELRPLGRPAHTQPLYGLRYPGSPLAFKTPEFKSYNIHNIKIP